MFDVLFASTILAICSIPMLVIAAVILLTSPGPALLFQERVGLGGRGFRMIKFRTMTHGTEQDQGLRLTSEGDLRITSVGRLMRRWKLDELPQFFNILKGDMSLVGPRPKLAKYVGIPCMPYRPGITGVASIAFRREEQILSGLAAERIEHFYSEHIKPVKAELDVCYMCRATLASDLQVVAATVLSCLLEDASPAHALLSRVTEYPPESGGAVCK